MLTDIALGLTPGVGWAKDVYEAITGRSLVTGKELDWVDRGFAIFGAVSAGIGSKVKTGLEAIGTVSIGMRAVEGGKDLSRSAKLASDLAKEFQIARTAEVLTKLPSDYRSIRIKPGNSEKIAIIGRPMYGEEGSVTKLAGILESNKVTVEVFKPTDPADAQWRALMKEWALKGLLVPEKVVRETRVYQENHKWISKLKESRWTILDVGEQAAKGQSHFYDMEVRRIFGKSNF